MAQNTAVRGQITLIRLENFMTYDFIELRPGFNLNLIIGPNGTGKSTFVCAVMLALGAKLKYVGRADYIKSFVKNGCEEAIIEVELYDPSGGNLIISRKIDLQGCSQYSINGKAANSVKVAEIRNMFNISLDNLCSFLPQEKVQDFSRLTPQQLLDQTQKAAGSDEMRNDYNHLKDLLVEVKRKQSRYNNLTNEINQLSRRNERIKDKVMAYIENQALIEKEILLKQKRIWIFYNFALNELREIQSTEVALEQEFEELESHYKDNVRTAEELQRHIGEIDFRLKEIAKDRVRVVDKYREKVKLLRELINRFELIDYFAQYELDEQEKKKIEFNQYQETLDKLMNDLNTFVKKNGTDEELKAREKQVNSDIESNEKEKLEMMEKKGGIEDELVQLKTEIKNTSIEYQLLEKRRNFRLEYLKRYEPDVYKSVEWLKENEGLFQGRVFKPMLLELDITDVKYAKFIEARIAFRDLISFTCTNPDDLNLLVKKLRTDLKLRVNAICSEDGDNTQYSPDITLEKIREFGFSIYMKDFIIGPPEIIRYLCKVYRIHTIPVGDDSVNNNCDRVPRQLPLFFSENHMFSVKISVYSGEKSISVKPVHEPKIFSVLLNNQKMMEVMEREKQLITQSKENETKLKLATHSLKDLNNKQVQLRQAKRNVVNLIAEKEQIENHINQVANYILQLEKIMKSPETIRQNLEDERVSLKEKISDCFAFIKAFIKELGILGVRACEEEIQKNVVRNNIKKLSGNQDALATKMAKHEQVMFHYNRKKITKNLQCKSLKKELVHLTGGIPPGDEEFKKFERAFLTVRNTIEELDADIEEINVITELMGAGDAELKAEYDDRQNKIKDLSAALEVSKKDLEKIIREFEYLRRKWLAPMNDLVSKINELYGNFFETMGCVGEVRLTTGEDADDFEKYGIEIRVKFRDEVPLHPLGRHFQSGGERAVATAVYLLSLQELVTVPFRFVDEINQGMDPVNEKRMIDLMVKVTDKKNSVQYFFLTPKLLPDIQCSERMIVHTIYSGSESFTSKMWNLDSYLNLE